MPAPAGFWLGLWQGLISPITFVISLFTDGVNIYEVRNTGNWYDVGLRPRDLLRVLGGRRWRRRREEEAVAEGGSRRVDGPSPGGCGAAYSCGSETLSPRSRMFSTGSRLVVSHVPSATDSRTAIPATSAVLAM